MPAFKYPFFDFSDPHSWDKYQTKMKNNLFSLSSERDPVKIDKTVDDWVAIANNGTLSQCQSMYSVINYFFPQRIASSYFKSRIEFFYDKLKTIIEAKLRDKEVKTAPTAPPVKVKAPESPKAESVKIDAKDLKMHDFDTEFPTFTEDGFPDATSDIFEKLLSKEK